MTRRLTQSCRAGLTLIELVLAVAGCSLLLVLIATLLTSQSRLMTRCQQTVETTRASLRLSQWLREDLSQLAWMEDDTQASFSGASIGERVLQLDYQLADSPLQLYGTHDSVSLSRYVPTEPMDQQGVSSRLLCTVWADPAASKKSIPYLSADGQLRFQATPSSQTQKTVTEGVTRKQNQIGKQALEIQRSSFAEAIRSIRFRYFDGQQWHECWDSHERRGLPMAIEFNIHLIDSSEPQRFVHALITKGQAGREFGL